MTGKRKDDVSDDVLNPRAPGGSVPAGCGDGNVGEFLMRSGLSQAELLRKLSDGDPLGMVERCSCRVRGKGLLIDGDRLVTRALLISVAVERPERRESMDAWLDQRIDAAITNILDEDRRSLSSGAPVPFEAPHALVEEAFGVEPSTALAAAVAFNGLQEPARRAFMALFVENRSLAHCIEANLGTRESLVQAARQGLRALTSREPAREASSATLGGGA